MQLGIKKNKLFSSALAFHSLCAKREVRMQLAPSPHFNPKLKTTIHLIINIKQK